MLKLGSIYPRYVGPRSNIPGGTLDGGYVRFATPVSVFVAPSGVSQLRRR